MKTWDPQSSVIELKFLRELAQNCYFNSGTQTPNLRSFRLTLTCQSLKLQPRRWAYGESSRKTCCLLVYWSKWRGKRPRTWGHGFSHLSIKWRWTELAIWKFRFIHMPALACPIVITRERLRVAGDVLPPCLSPSFLPSGLTSRLSGLW